MNSNKNINLREMVVAFSSYEGMLISFCNINHIFTSQLYVASKNRRVAVV